MNATTRLWVSGLFFLVIFASGFWLGRTEKPYSMINLDIHKLIALVAAVFLGVWISRINRLAPLDSIQWLAVAVAAVCAVVTIVTGGLASIDKPLPAILSTLHKVFPYLTLLSTAGLLYLLLRIPPWLV